MSNIMHVNICICTLYVLLSFTKVSFIKVMIILKKDTFPRF